MSKPVNPWQRLGSKQVYANPWISVREDQVITPNGTPGIYGVVEANTATGVLAIDAIGRVVLVGQYRYPIERYSWEIVEGGAEGEEPPLDAIKRELREEAGYEASSWEQLGSEIHLSNCYTDEVGFLFVARGLREVPRHLDPTEVIEVRTVTQSEALRMIDTGEITDGLTIIALLRAYRAGLIKE